MQTSSLRTPAKDRLKPSPGEDRQEAPNFFFEEIFKMAKVGGWEIDMVNNTVFWSEQTKRIHEVYNDYIPTVEKAINFFYGNSKAVIIDKFKRLTEEGEPYDVELEFLTARKRKIWVRAVAKPVFDNEGKVVGVRGLFQDIDEQKKRELALQTSLELINKQADKLKDFAHIVSHNLRSHTGNLMMITNMIELETEPEMKLEWLEHIKGLSESLDETVTNLRDIVNSHIGVQAIKKHIFFSDVYEQVVNALGLRANNSNLKLNVDFSECECIDYVPAYLESIILNLITNAIKYKHPDRTPVIAIRTFFEEGRICLQVSDNGIGIDLTKYGNRLFKMNETFHNNADARGIGLYITKNQIEKMGGSIEATSIVDKGTTFKIKF
jgi:PAS domain S-box-containing protein